MRLNYWSLQWCTALLDLLRRKLLSDLGIKQRREIAPTCLVFVLGLEANEDGALIRCPHEMRDFLLGPTHVPFLQTVGVHLFARMLLVAPFQLVQHTPCRLPQRNLEEHDAEGVDVVQLGKGRGGQVLDVRMAVEIPFLVVVARVERRAGLGTRVLKVDEVWRVDPSALVLSILEEDDGLTAYAFVHPAIGVELADALGYALGDRKPLRQRPKVIGRRGLHDGV